MGRLGGSERGFRSGLLLQLHCASTKVVRAMIHHEVIGHFVAVGHRTRRLRKLDVVLHAKRGKSWRNDADQRAKVKGTLYPDEFDAGSMTVGNGAIDNWQKNCRVGNCSIVDYCNPCLIMKAQYCKRAAEVTPAVVEEVKPIISYAINRGGQVELLTQRIKLNSKVDEH